MQNMLIAYKYPIPRKHFVSTNLYVLESCYILSVFSWLFLLLKLSGYLWRYFYYVNAMFYVYLDGLMTSLRERVFENKAHTNLLSFIPQTSRKTWMNLHNFMN